MKVFPNYVEVPKMSRFKSKMLLEISKQLHFIPYFAQTK